MRESYANVDLPLLFAALTALLIGCQRNTTSRTDGVRADDQGSNSPLAVVTREAFERRYGLGLSPRVFGPYWFSTPSPTIAATNAMAAVDAFLATNGWNMSTGGVSFTWGFTERDMKPIHGLPWLEIKDREFPAVTSGGILYVLLDSFSHIASGVAYNPKTNRFAEAISGFKPLGGHWYAWVQPDDPEARPQQYEGQTK